TERAVVERRKGESVVCWDKRVVEDMGLVKIDILGLNTLDLIALAQEYIRERHSKKVDLSRIPLDDEKVLENFAKGMTTGVFQFESPGMKKLLRDLGRDGTLTFEDVSAATALYRPGPMDSGMLDSYVKRKQGLENIDYDHPDMAPALNMTYGVMVYQEQVMQIARDIAGYSMADADKLRKIMGKKLPEEMAKQRDVFVEGCVKHVQMDEYDAGQLFDKIAKFAGYGFNKSHSVEYSLISYQCMYLKTYYCVEFTAAALSLMKDEKLPGLIRDAERLGIEVLYPDVNLSTGRFEILNDAKVIMPFTRIKQISTRASDAIVKARQDGEYESREDLEKRVERRACNIRHINNLDAVGAFARIEEDQLPSNHPDRLKQQVELLPGLISAVVPIGRDINKDRLTKTELLTVINDYVTAHGPGGEEVDGMPVRPLMGKNCKFAAVFDAPSSGEDKVGQMTHSMSFHAVLEALGEVGLTRADGYWTALIKRPKEGKMVSQEEIATYAPYLDREIELLKPPLIVLMGSQAIRRFIPDFKGKASDSAGKVIYDQARDTNLLLGFSPGEIYFDESKQTLMNEVFQKVASIIE
ncbi:MAG: hypothetical protein JJ979_03600, partial [Roseibium sp.]|nr:hypothetical protein [Roseibium sp.]